MSLQRKESWYWWGCNPQDEVSMQGALREEECCLLPCCPREGPAGALSVIVLLTHRSILALGPLERHPEHQMAHQRAESNFSHRIASGSSTHCQFKVVSLPNWLLFSARAVVVFFFLNTAIFMLGITCRIGWKDIDYHSIKFPRSDSSCLFVFVWLRNVLRAALGVEATLRNKEKFHECKR